MNPTNQGFESDLFDFRSWSSPALPVEAEPDSNFQLGPDHFDFDRWSSASFGAESENRGAVDEAKPALVPQPTAELDWKQALERMQGLGDIASAFAEVLPFAKLASGVFHSITDSDPLIRQLESEEGLKILLGPLVGLHDTITQSNGSELSTDERLRGAFKRASIQLADLAFFVRDYCKVRDPRGDVVSGVDILIQGYCSKLEELQSEFHIHPVAETEIKVVRMLKVIEGGATNLGEINYVSGAGLDIKKMCLDGTRVELLQDIMEWVSLDSSTSQIMWLCGGTGTGKSAIAHTIAARFEQMGRLGSMFCFSENEKATRKPTSLFPNIAQDLADLDQNFRAALSNTIATNSNHTPSNIAAQFEKLVSAPTNDIREILNGPIIIVIDALDECGTAEERDELLKVLGTQLKKLPSNFRFIITSRPDLDIQAGLRSGPDLFIKRMDGLSADSTLKDITAFVRLRLSEDPEVDDEMCQGLASHARGLFQWATVACQFVLNRALGETARSSYQGLIRPLASKSEGEINGDTLLDYLYRFVLSKALPLRNEPAMDDFKSVMAHILTAFEPLSRNSLNALPKVSNVTPTNRNVDDAISHLGSVLSGVDEQDMLIRPLHTSFRDFLTDPKRSGEFFVDLNDLALRLEFMISQAVIFHRSGQLDTARSLCMQVLGPEARTTLHEWPQAGYMRILSAINSLADDYRKQGSLNEAATFYTQILYSRQERLGEHHVDTLQSVESLAGLYFDQSHVEESITLHQRILESRKKHLGVDHADTLRSMTNIADIHCHQARFTEAEDLYLQVLKLQKGGRGVELGDTISSLINLAEILRHRGRVGDTANLYRHVMEVQKERLGIGHEATIRSMVNLADIYYIQELVDEAAALYLQVLETRNIGGEKRDGILNALSNLAEAYRHQGRINEAVKLYSEVLESRKEQPGADHMDTLHSMTNLADIYRSQGRLLDSASLHSQVLECHKKRFGDNHVNTLVAMSNLAVTYRSLGRLSDAVELYSKILECRKGQPDVDPTIALSSMTQLAEVYHDQGLLNEATVLLSEVLSTRKELSGVNDPKTLDAMTKLALAYRNQGLFARSTSLFSKILDIRQQCLEGGHPDLLESLKNLAVAYEHQGDLDKAAKLYKETMETQKMWPGVSHKDKLELMNNLALTYGNLGQSKEAAELLSQVIEIQKSSFGEDHPDTLASIRDLEHILCDAHRVTVGVNGWGSILKAQGDVATKALDGISLEEPIQKPNQNRFFFLNRLWFIVVVLVGASAARWCWTD